MIQHYFNLLNDGFTILLVFRISGLILFILSIIGIFLIVIIILLDQFYRPNTSQLPFNFYFDRLFPLIALFVPSLSMLLLCPISILWIQRFFILILVHCLLLIPLFTYWSNLRSWDYDKSSSSVDLLSWSHPRLYKHIAIALIYPSIWGIYFSTLRYLRLGSTIDLYNVCLSYSNIFIFLFFFFYFTFPVYYKVFALFLMIRNLLWDHTITLFYSFHIYLLRYFVYFRLCELIYKAHFLYHDILSGSVGATTWDLTSVAYYRKVISYIYYKPIILSFIYFSLIISELICFNGQLFYSIYILFLYPLLFSCFRCFSLFGFSKFIKDVCLCDYITHNFINPRYPLIFWSQLLNASFYYGFEQQFDPDIVSILGTTSLAYNEMYKHIIKRRKEVIYMYRVWGRRYSFNIKSNPMVKSIITGNPKRWSIRISAAYSSKTGIRWFHTSKILQNPLPNKIHTGTLYFIKNNPYAIIALINHPSSNFSSIQQITKKLIMPSPQTLYNNIPNNILLDNKKNTLIDTLESNFVMRFKPLTVNGVIVGTYNNMKEQFGYSSLQTMQMRPDLLSLWNQSIYNYKGYLGIDQKTKNATNFGRNQAIVTSKEQYNKLLLEYTEALDKKHKITPEMLVILEQLSKEQNFDEMLLLWSKSLDLFPEKWKPPLLLNKTFDESNLKPEIIERIRAGEVYIVRISDELYTLNISEETGTLPDNAIDLFNGSFLQEEFYNSDY